MQDASKKRVAITELVNKLLADDAVLVVPSAPGPAPVLNLDQETLGVFRGKLLSMTSIAGVCKLPQVCTPRFHRHLPSQKPACPYWALAS